MDLSTAVNGLLLGGFYAALALGLSLVFGVLRLINLAHGELILGGAYLSLQLSRWFGWGTIASLPVVVAVIALVGYLLQRLLLTHLLISGAEGALVATFGLSLIAQAVFADAFSSDPQSLSAPFATGGMTLAGIRVRTAYVVAFSAGVLLSGLAHLLMSRTRVGAVVRAAAADPTTAGLVGYDIRRVYAWTFAACAGVAAIGGVLLGITFSFAPTSGGPYLLVSIAVVVIGGVGNVAGTLVAGLALGLIQATAAGELGGGYRDLAVYLLFFAVLVVRPAGLFPAKVRA